MGDPEHNRGCERNTHAEILLNPFNSAAGRRNRILRDSRAICTGTRHFRNYTSFTKMMHPKMVTWPPHVSSDTGVQCQCWGCRVKGVTLYNTCHHPPPVPPCDPFHHLRGELFKICFNRPVFYSSPAAGSEHTASRPLPPIQTIPWQKIPTNFGSFEKNPSRSRRVQFTPESVRPIHFGLL
jgi:hypothetical protein